MKWQVCALGTPAPCREPVRGQPVLDCPSALRSPAFSAYDRGTRKASVADVALTWVTVRSQAAPAGCREGRVAPEKTGRRTLCAALAQRLPCYYGWLIFALVA